MAVGAVAAFVVIDDGEDLELVLQLGDRCRRGLASEPAFEGLVETFDLDLGLRVVGVAVLLGDVELPEEVFEAVAAADETGGIDHAVVGKR